MNKQEIEKAIITLEAEKKRQYDLLDALPPKSRDRAIEITKMIQACEFGISAMEQQLTNGWIPVDSKPENYRNEYGELIPFLVCVKDTDYPFRAFFDGKHWGDGISRLDVIAWQSLPEPYKENKDA